MVAVPKIVKNVHWKMFLVPNTGVCYLNTIWCFINIPSNENYKLRTTLKELKSNF